MTNLPWLYMLPQGRALDVGVADSNMLLLPALVKLSTSVPLFSVTLPALPKSLYKSVFLDHFLSSVHFLFVCLFVLAT